MSGHTDLILSLLSLHRINRPLIVFASEEKTHDTSPHNDVLVLSGPFPLSSHENNGENLASEALPAKISGIMTQICYYLT